MEIHDDKIEKHNLDNMEFKDRLKTVALSLIVNKFHAQSFFEIECFLKIEEILMHAQSTYYALLVCITKNNHEMVKHLKHEYVSSINDSMDIIDKLITAKKESDDELRETNKKNH